MPKNVRSRKEKSAALPYAALMVVAFVLLTIFVHSTYNFLNYMQHGRAWSRTPFQMDDSGQVVQYPEPEAAKAGVHQGDRVLTLDGQDYTSLQQLQNVLAATAPGSPLHARIQHKDNTLANVSIPLVALQSRSPNAALWTSVGFLRIVFPLLCLVLGFWAVLAKPNDRNAWFLLGIFAFFTVLFEPFGSQPIHLVWVEAIAVFGRPFLAPVAFACIMLFGLYFPERTVIDRRVPWLKWIILASLGILLVLDLIHTYHRNFDFQGSHFLSRWTDAVHLTESILMGVCIPVFFTGIISNLHTAETADTIRRLRVLRTGSAIGLGGLLLLFVLSFIHGGMIEQVLPLWLVFIILAIPLLFPVTLAYVVVVQRAMDLNILVRQGTKYAFARGTLWALQFLLVAIITFRIARLMHKPHVTQVDILLIFILGLMFLALRFRVAGSVSNWLDKKFFREAYSAEQILSQLAEQARGFTETKPLLDTITHSIGETLHIDRIGVLLRAGNTFSLQQAIGLDTTDHPVILQDNSSTIRHLHRSNVPATLYEDEQDGWLLLANESERRTLRQLSAELLLPLHGRKELVGIMALGPKRSEEPYSNTDLQLLKRWPCRLGWPSRMRS